MASFNPHISIPTAIDSRNSFDLSCDHITTMNFFESRVTYAKEIMKGESIDINVESFVRLAPLVVPTFGRMNIVHRAFFVPFRCVWRKWNAFITDSVYNGSVVDVVPNFSMSTLTAVFNSSNDYSVEAQPGTAYDFVNSAHKSRKFTVKGRSIYNLLVSLGYKCTFHAGDQSKLSALPLLCYCKAMRDWIINENFNQVATQRLDAFFESPENLTYSELKGIFDTIYENVSLYEQDYFTASWVNPTGPNSNLNTASLNIRNVNEALPTNVDVFSVEGNDAQINTDEGYTNQFILDALKHVSDYLKRHQFVGSKIIDRYLVHYGVKLDPAVLNRSYYLGKANTPIQIGDIMSTADTDGAVLGQYAGRGLGYDKSGHFSLQSVNEFGYVIVISQVCPKVGYVQGVNRMNLHLKPRDFFTPEFDGFGARATARKELFVSTDAVENEQYDGADNFEGIFGYLPQYAEYKCGKDCMSGNYIFPSINVGEDAWHLFRKVDETSDYREINNNFVNTVIDRDQYSRIFNGSLGIDPFRCIFHFDVKCSLPTTKLFDNYEWHERGKTVSEVINGSGNLAGNQ